MTRLKPLRLLEGRVDGELEGVGCCRLKRNDGLATVRYDWQVRTTQWWKNLLGPLAKPAVPLEPRRDHARRRHRTGSPPERTPRVEDGRDFLSLGAHMCGP